MNWEPRRSVEHRPRSTWPGLPWNHGKSPAGREISRTISLVALARPLGLGKESVGDMAGEKATNMDE